MPANDPRTTGELFEVTTQGDPDEQAAWEAVSALRLRNTEEVFQIAVHYTEPADPHKRARGLDVLAQLGRISTRVSRLQSTICMVRMGWSSTPLLGRSPTCGVTLRSLH